MNSLRDVNAIEYGNISKYDPVLGWSGVPSAEASMVTRNRRILLSDNSQGNRDIEHPDEPNGKPAIVFLGDSFTWGYEVEWDEMFVNIIRERLPAVEIFNLSHRGYGTDQAYLSYLNWRTDWRPELVVLMFSANDVADNNANFRYEKPKPYFRVVDGDLVLEGVPVEETRGWDAGGAATTAELSWADKVEDFLFFSHFLRDIGFRIVVTARGFGGAQASAVEEDLSVTVALIKALQTTVQEAGAELVVFFIPSKVEVGNLSDAPPYQQKVKALFDENGITSFDMADHMKSVWRRTYYRRGTHLNAYGHSVLSDGVYEVLAEMMNN